jgi:hypothetical protein
LQQGRGFEGGGFIDLDVIETRVTMGEDVTKRDDSIALGDTR